MKIEKHKLKKIGKSIICVAIGTFFGILTYGLFLYYNINVLGWNLGLIFAPLIAGYVETLLANKIIGGNIGAISAFILFIDTTIYSFILKNPSLGVNLISIGSIVVILQSAFPTLINHIILVVIGGILSKLINKSKKFIERLQYSFDKHQSYHDSSNVKNKTEGITYFNENESNTRLNSLDFIFITSSDMETMKHELIGIYESEIILEKNNMLGKDYEESENIILNMIKKGKDDCLINLVKQIKKNGGNGVLNLSMNYTSIGVGGDNIQITAIGMGIKI